MRLGALGVRGVVQAKECTNWCRILVDFYGTQPNAVWELLTNAHSRNECSRDPKLPRRWCTQPSKLISVLGRDPLQRASQQDTACWPEMRDFFPTQRSAIAAGEDAKKQIWHTDVDKLPGRLPCKVELPGRNQGPCTSDHGVL